MNQEMKSIALQLNNVMNEFTDMLNVNIPNMDVTLKEAIEIGIMQYAMYLSEADGQLSFDEVEFINIVFGYSFTYSDMHTLVSNNSKDFDPNEIPLSILLTSVLGGENGKAVKSTIISLYEKIGEFICKSDGNASSSEINKHNSYIRFLNSI